MKSADTNRKIDAETAANIAEAAVTRTSGVPATLYDVEELSEESRRNLVLRSKVALGKQSHSIIIKVTRSPDYAASSADLFANSGLAKEWVARELLGQSQGHNSSALLAGDAEYGLIVFEDFGSHLSSLDTILLNGSASAAEAALTAYAISLGKLHAATVDCAQRHATIIRKTFSAAAIPASVGADWMERPLPEIEGVAIPNDEIEVVRSRLAEPGPWIALVHGDSCPDNVLLSSGQARLLDFEFSAPGHMLLDAVYWRIGFPTCWCAGAVPDDVADRIDAAYRGEVIAVLPEIADDHVFATEAALISVAWTLHNLRWLLESALLTDSTWGIASRRSRILWYLDAAITACRKADILPRCWFPRRTEPVRRIISIEN